MSLEILYQDEDFVAVNKPSGLLTHPYWKETNETRCLLKDLRDQLGKKLYPVHRLDRPVSGITLFGLNSEAVSNLQKLWSTEEVEKFYLALVRERQERPMDFFFPLKNEKKVEQEARTLACPLELFKRCSLMEVEIKTGRKHQIRRHFARSACHVIGDRMYGKKPINDLYRDRYGVNRIFLHAHRLRFLQPNTSKRVEISCPLPSDLAQALVKIRQDPDS